MMVWLPVIALAAFIAGLLIVVYDLSKLPPPRDTGKPERT